ncbi:MAG TPA: transcription antitermination factor NusB [Chitinophagales bacterium]|nr:transcription antitermination factor NusB [Chitinophagales bacterium]
MQTIYAHEQDREKTLDRLEKSMLENINAASRAFLYNLYVLCKTAEYVNTDLQIRSVKFIPSEDDKILSASLFHNPIIQHLVVNEDLYREIQKEKLDTRIDPDYFRQFFQKLKKTDEYSAYSRKENPLFTDDREIILFLYKKILLPDDLFQQLLEDIFHTWQDDREPIYHAILNFIDTVPPNHDAFIIRQSKDLKEVKQFAVDLLRKTIYNDEETEALIVPILENWDKERVALLDMLLMKMALTELLYFPEIPVKVTMNEYIDLSKNYSTPKSGEFINGILDSVLRKLREENKIQKTGRGLQEGQNQ